MKKSSFAALLLGTVSGLLFALGMCMSLLPEWDALLPGVILGGAGLLLGLITLLLWRRMEHKPPIKISARLLVQIAVGVLGALALGVGMCLCMVWQQMLWGIVVGIGGIAVLLCLIPMIKGLHD